jgi:hypothetical protein
MCGSTRAIRPVRARAALLAASILFGACSTRPRINLPLMESRQAAAILSARDQTINSVESPAIMEYSGPDGHLKAREQITLRRPAGLRVEAMSPLGVALIVVADAGQIAVFDPSRNTLMRGPATSETLERFARIPMEPRRAVRLLMGLAPDSATLSLAPSEVHDENGMKLLTYAPRDGMVDQLGFAQNHLVLVRGKSASGQLIYEVKYGDYRDIGAATFPYEIDASFPATGTKLKLRYERPEIDRPIPDSTFTLSPGPATRLINLGRGDMAADAAGG